MNRSAKQSLGRGTVSGLTSEPATAVDISKAPPRRRWWFFVVMAVGLTGLLLFVGFLVLRSSAHPVKVDGTAMEPALMNGDRLMVKDKVGDLKRGDIVLFHYPKDPRKSFVERIIALPGETISIDEFGAVLINDSEIHEPYVTPERNRSPRRILKSPLADDEYFVMGDNRDAANDSRSWGLVQRRLIYGKVMGRYWPIWR